MKKYLPIIGCILFGLMIAVSGTAILLEKSNMAAAAQSFQTLRQEIPKESPAEEKAASPQATYGSLKKENPDMVGWIQIDDTPIDYPVMQTPQENTYYLHHDFQKKQSIYGVPFVDAACDVSSLTNNLIVYGHNMRDGEMFASLLKYQDSAYLSKHPLIHFDTMDAFGTYEITNVLKVTATMNDPNAVDFSRFSIFNTKDEYQSFQKMCKKFSLYDTGKSIRNGERLLILSTCEYSQKNGRMIVIARKVT